MFLFVSQVDYWSVSWIRIFSSSCHPSNHFSGDEVWFSYLWSTFWLYETIRSYKKRQANNPERNAPDLIQLSMTQSPAMKRDNLFSFISLMLIDGERWCFWGSCILESCQRTNPSKTKTKCAMTHFFVLGSYFLVFFYCNTAFVSSELKSSIDIQRRISSFLTFCVNSIIATSCLICIFLLLQALMTSAGCAKYLWRVRWDYEEWVGSWIWRETKDLNSIYWSEIHKSETLRLRTL